MIVSLLVFVTILVLAIPSALVFIPLHARHRQRGARSTRRLLHRPRRLPRRRHPHCTLRAASIPAGRACIFMANHVSNLDAPALIANLPGRTSVFLKRPLLKIPIFGYAFKLGEFIPVDRDGDVASAQQAVADAQRVLAKGLHITTFVEGTRSPDGRLLPFKKGPFYLAKDTGAPCIPVSIYGTEKIMARGSLRINPGTAHFVFHPPSIPPTTPLATSSPKPSAPPSPPALPEWMRNQKLEASS